MDEKDWFTNNQLNWVCFDFDFAWTFCYYMLNWYSWNSSILYDSPNFSCLNNAKYKQTWNYEQ
jgi:hypothetical protein